VRKVLIVAREAGVMDGIAVEHVRVLATAPTDAMLQINPLGQIPALVLSDGEAIYDSAAICHYLDVECGHGLLHPTSPHERTLMMRRQALGDTLSTLLLSWMGEKSRAQPEQSEIRISAVRKKLPFIFTALENDVRASSFDVGHAACVAALGYLEFRLAAECGWRATHPQLAQWFAAVSARPSVAATAYYDETKGA
jgi:glutathione S-transferase